MNIQAFLTHYVDSMATRVRDFFTIAYCGIKGIMQVKIKANTCVIGF